MTATTIPGTDAPVTPVDSTPRMRRRRAAADLRRRVGPADKASIEQVLALVDDLPTWRASAPQKERAARRRGAARVLAWLAGYPGEGWQQRWLSCGAGRQPDLINLIIDPDDPRGPTSKHHEVVAGLAVLVLCRIILPDYGVFTNFHAKGLFEQTRRLRRPDLFARLEQAAAELRMLPANAGNGIRAITRMVIVTGRGIDQLTVDDLHEYRDWQQHRSKERKSTGAHAAWDLLRALRVIPAEESMPQALRLPPRTTAELVDLYKIRNGAVRDLLIRYLDERRPGLDFSTLRSMASVLVGQFWADIEHHHPDIDTLHLPTEVVAAWKQRLQTLKRVDVAGQPRRGYARSSPPCGRSTSTSPNGRWKTRAGYRGPRPSPSASPTPPGSPNTSGRSPRRCTSGFGSGCPTCRPWSPAPNATATSRPHSSPPPEPSPTAASSTTPGAATDESPRRTPRQTRPGIRPWSTRSPYVFSLSPRRVLIDVGWLV